MGKGVTFDNLGGMFPWMIHTDTFPLMTITNRKPRRQYFKKAQRRWLFLRILTSN